MQTHDIVSRGKWLGARRTLLAEHKPDSGMDELSPALSVFLKDEDGAIYHSHSS